MDTAILKGIYFVLTGGIMTQSGLILGMYASLQENAKKAIIAAVLSTAIADSLGDGIGIFYGEKTKYNNLNSNKAFISAISLIIAKVLLGLMYAIIIYFNNIRNGVIISMIVSLLLLLISLNYLAILRKENKKEFIIRNLLIILITSIVSYIIGVIINNLID
jgi:VIT1/CCC1 family predicted Fe2+/Mn2+ transporter